MELNPIGVIHTPFKSAAGTPVQPRFAKGAQGEVELLEEYMEGLEGLDGFSRIWLVYWCDRANAVSLKVTPYLDTTPHGLFATRAPSRPNPIGISCVRLLGIEGNRLGVQEVDMLDGSPLLDLKPYVPGFDSFEDERTGWMEKPGIWEAAKGMADERFEE